MVPGSLLLFAIPTILFLQVNSAAIRFEETEIGCSACYFAEGNMTIRMDNEVVQQMFYNNGCNPIDPAEIEKLGETPSTRIICRLICGLITGYDNIPKGFTPWRQPDGWTSTHQDQSLEADTAEPQDIHQEEAPDQYGQFDLPMENHQTDNGHPEQMST